jgi:hypothetical protein
MLSTIPVSIAILFSTTTLATVLYLYWLISRAETAHTRRLALPVLVGLIGWCILQTTLASVGLYSTNLLAQPPKLIAFGVLPMVLFMLTILFTQRGRRFMDSLPPAPLTYLHTIRIPVEITLYCLFLAHTVPEIMTFAGRNFDILAGLTAPFVAYFVVQKKVGNRRIALLWHLLSLALLTNIVVIAALSAPLPFQQVGFEQPNVAILYAPYTLLPTVVVPIVLFCHIAAIRQFSQSRPIILPVAH